MFLLQTFTKQSVIVGFVLQEMQLQDDTWAVVRNTAEMKKYMK